MGMIKLFISFSEKFRASLLIVLTARSLTTVSSCWQSDSKCGSTIVCCEPSKPLHLKQNTLYFHIIKQ